MVLDRAPKRILAVKLADLGDLLSVTPALQALRAAYPSARIDLLVPPQSASLLQGAGYIDRILQFDKFPFDRKRGLLDMRRAVQTARFLLELRMSRYDLLVLFHHLATRWGTFKFAAVSLATGARVRAGLDNGRGGFLNVRLPDEGFGAMHEVDYWLALVGLLGADASGGWRPHISIDEKSRARVTTLLDEMGINRASPLVAIHPGAGWYSRARIWPVEGFAAVARGLAKSHGATVLVLGGPDEAPIAARLVELAGEGGRVVDMVGRTSIVETAALIEECDLFVGNDSGPMHIAAAVGTPVVAVFGPSNVGAWEPYAPPEEENPHRVVARDLQCMPCFYRGHSVGLKEGCGTRECLTLLGHGRVLEACREMLDGPRTKDEGPKATEAFASAT
jgi:lipopolysaccharide heptosyltransferase II